MRNPVVPITRLALCLTALMTSGQVFSADAINISSRAYVETGKQVLNSGIVVVGPGNKDFLFKALGPSMADKGVKDTLPDPHLRVVNVSSGEIIADVEDWEDGPSGERLIEESLQPKDPKEAAVILNLSAGAYSMQVTGGTGNAQAVVRELGLIGDSSYDSLAGLWGMSGHPGTVVSINRGIASNSPYVSALIGDFSSTDTESVYMEGTLNNNVANIGSEIPVTGGVITTAARLRFTSSGNAILRFSACSCVYPLNTDLHMVKVW